MQLDNVRSDIVDNSGLAILREIVGGERYLFVLARHRDWRVKASTEEIAGSVEGN